jgi:hypothetical protein
MNRYYLSPIIGDGLTPDSGFRPALADKPMTAGVWIIPTDANGKPIYDWCLCYVEAKASEQVNIAASPGIESLPDTGGIGALDLKTSAVANAVKTKVQNLLTAKGVNITLDGQSTFRDVIRGFGQKLDSAFDEKTFFAS